MLDISRYGENNKTFPAVLSENLEGLIFQIQAVFIEY